MAGTSSISTSTGTSSINGLVSGMDTSGIVTQLMELEKRPLTSLQNQKTALNTQLTAWQDANTRILALKIQTDTLTQGSTFDTKSFSTGDNNVITGTTGTDAQEGTYFLTVNALAQTHQLKTQGFADTNTQTVGTGSIGIKVGDAAAITVTIDDKTNTLTGLRDAINSANAGVTAAIINDGSSTNQYRLMLTSNTSGMAGEITMTSSLSGGTTPAFSTLQAAQDASITLGSGDGAITVNKSTNSVTDLIPNVILNLQEASPNKPITVKISNNRDSIKQNIQNFIDQYNNLMDYMNDQFSYDPETNATGTLFTDSNLQGIQADLLSKASEAVKGMNGSSETLADIGITFTTDNKLSLDSTALDNALTYHLNDVKHLFATVGDTSNTNITYIGSESATKPGTYGIDITQPATKARVTAGVAQTGILTKDETLTIKGIKINLTVGMTQDQVVDEINKKSAQTGVVASATDASGAGSGNYLTLTSSGYGSSQTLSIKSNASNADPLTYTSGIGNLEVTQANAVGESGMGSGEAGKDIAGTIGGEAATGIGQTLTANTSNNNTSGLKIVVNASAIGSYGTISLSKGIANSLSEYMSSITDTYKGSVNTAETGLQDQMKDIDQNIADMQERLTAKQDQLTLQFANMEGILSKLKSTGDYLTAQFKQIALNASASS